MRFRYLGLIPFASLQFVDRPPLSLKAWLADVELTCTVMLERSDVVEIGGPTRGVLLRATCETNPPPHAEAALRQLADGLVPDGTDIDRSTRLLMHDDEPVQPTFAELPPSLRDFSRSLRDLFDTCASRVAWLIRWRHALPRFDVEGSTAGREWSDDGATWHPVPVEWTTRTSSWVVPILDAKATAELQTMLDADLVEPPTLAHQMLREARSVASRHPASALMMAVAAAEIGTKQYISRLVPSASWLLDNVNSPPLVQILREYAPKLETGVGEPFEAPEEMLEALQKAVHMRNRVAHGGFQPPGDRVDSVLDHVEKLLWRLDYHLGQHWARSQW